jgi:alpha-tubulin suppressor-like RCC1 family protein
MAPAVPTPTPLLLTGVANVAFSGQACALTRAGTVYCWGSDDFLGNGSGPSDSPVAVAGIDDAIDVAVGANADLGSGVATLVALADGTVVGWGQAHGPGLTGPADADQLKSIPMPGLTNVRQITIASTHACAVLIDGQVSCWGSNVDGQLGVPTPTPPVAAPTTISGLDNVAAVRAGDLFTCARRINGEVLCWGNNAFGELALPESKSFSKIPTTVDVPPVTDLAVGQAHACVRVNDGSLRCWGDN